MSTGILHPRVTRITVPCELCGEPTIYTETKRCDACWHVERAVESNPELARRVLQRLDEEKGRAA